MAQDIQTCDKNGKPLEKVQGTICCQSGEFIFVRGKFICLARIKVADQNRIVHIQINKTQLSSDELFQIYRNQ